MSDEERAALEDKQAEAESEAKGGVKSFAINWFPFILSLPESKHIVDSIHEDFPQSFTKPSATIGQQQPYWAIQARVGALQTITSRLRHPRREVHPRCLGVCNLQRLHERVADCDEEGPHQREEEEFPKSHAVQYIASNTVFNRFISCHGLIGDFKQALESLKCIFVFLRYRGPSEICKRRTQILSSRTPCIGSYISDLASSGSKRK